VQEDTGGAACSLAAARRVVLTDHQAGGDCPFVLAVPFSTAIMRYIMEVMDKVVARMHMSCHMSCAQRALQPVCKG
jgi:hypothetical protein